MTRRAWAAFAAMSVIWGMPYLFIKIAVDDGVSPAFLSFARVVVAAVVLLVAVIAIRFDANERATGIRLVGLFVGLAGAVALVGIDVAGKTLGVAILGERPGAGAVAGLLLILAGSWLSTDGRLPLGFRRRPTTVVPA